MSNSPFPLHQEHQQHVDIRNASQRDYPQSSFGNPRLATSEGWATAQQLNNLGCVNVTMGNFPKANWLFELALKQHIDVTEPSFASPSSCRSSQCIANDATSRCDIDINSNSYEEDDAISIDSDYYYEDDDVSESVCDMKDDEDGYKMNQPSIRIVPAGATASSDPISSRTSLQRMTTRSTLRITSFCGQQRHAQSHNRSRMHNTFHEVYCLPIVMDELEWESSTLEDKIFVLIFNTAICNHLWGMEFQEHERQQGQQQGQRQHEEDIPQSQRSFLVANKLYHLALRNASSAGRATDNHPSDGHAPTGITTNIDYHLCLAAVLNNLSYISKTVIGTNSCEGLQFDRMLLTAIFWWRDSEEQKRISLATPMENTNNNSNSNSNSYDDADDTEIFDVFLEHVFYLLGVPEPLAPASAA